jgi:hypothetical protein
MQAATFLGGLKNVELAALGRRIVENELELLDLMEGVDAGPTHRRRAG